MDFHENDVYTLTEASILLLYRSLFAKDRKLAKL